MGRVAIFVDAGYLYAQGSKALTNSTKETPRPHLRINETAALAEFLSVCRANASSCDLLRVYWYDGINSFKGPSLEQDRLAHTDNIKMRFGFINSHGEQKGVDSLLVTDLVDLARNHAISDAVLISGDEDLRVGVQIAQQFGVRVHLVGIGSGNQSQSKTLKQEADTKTVWEKDTVAKFLSTTTSPSPAPTIAPTAIEQPIPSVVQAELTSDVEKNISEFIAEFESTDIVDLLKHWETSGGIPPEYDGRLLARCRSVLERDLDVREKKLVRGKFKALVHATGKTN